MGEIKEQTQISKPVEQTKIYNYHPQTGIYLGESLADDSPLEPGVFLIPAYATKIQPPEIPKGKEAVFVSGNWEIRDIPKKPEPDPTPAFTKEQKIAALDAEYQPQFTALAQSLGLATLDGNQTNIDSIKADYAALKAEYNTKREAINNG